MPAGQTPANHKLGVAWVLLCLGLALHVTDEALTGFLDVYNPTVTAMRQQFAWFPMPVFTYGIWLGGLIAAVIILLLLSPLFFRGARWIRPLAWFFAVIMILNALGHTLGTIAGQTVAAVHFPRPMPGFYSSPFMFLAAVYLIMQLRATGRQTS